MTKHMVTFNCLSCPRRCSEKMPLVCKNFCIWLLEWRNNFSTCLVSPGVSDSLNHPLLPPSLFSCNVISPSPSIFLTMSAALVHPALCLSPPELWALQALLVFKGASQQYETLCPFYYMAWIFTGKHTFSKTPNSHRPFEPCSLHCIPLESLV